MWVMSNESSYQSNNSDLCLYVCFLRCISCLMLKLLSDHKQGLDSEITHILFYSKLLLLP